MKNITVLSNNLLIEPIKTQSGMTKRNDLYIPTKDDKTTTLTGIVMAVGPETSIIVGATVVFKKYIGYDFDVSGKKLLFVEEKDILAIINS